MRYPSPAERTQIIEQRQMLAEALSELQATASGDEYSRRLDHLAGQYGSDTVQLVLDKIIAPTFTDDLIGGHVAIYREYRRTFARFGGARPFLSKDDYEQGTLSYTKAVARQVLKSMIPFFSKKPSRREQSLSDRLLLQVAYWEDITPPATPPRPENFAGPAPGVYDSPAQEILAWGWSYQEENPLKTEDLSRWRTAVPTLVELTLDEGLLAGWPGETASWGPYHALVLLGQLQAHEQAERLFLLLNRENDWLSDVVARVWGQMGPPVEAALWAYLGDDAHPAAKRSYAIAGLAAIAGRYPERRSEIITGLTDRLQQASWRDEVTNGYIAYTLNEMDAVEAKAGLLEAFRQDKIDSTIIAIDRVKFFSRVEQIQHKPRRRRR